MCVYACASVCVCMRAQVCVCVCECVCVCVNVCACVSRVSHICLSLSYSVYLCVAVSTHVMSLLGSGVNMGIAYPQAVSCARMSLSVCLQAPPHHGRRLPPSPHPPPPPTSPIPSGLYSSPYPHKTKTRKDTQRLHFLKWVSNFGR